MGIMLWVAGFVVLAALYIPGFLLVRGCGASRVAAVLCAPMVMVGLYVLVGMGLQQAGVFATGPLLVGVALTLSAAVFGLSTLVRRTSRRKSFQAVALPCENTAAQVVFRVRGGEACDEACDGAEGSKERRASAAGSITHGHRAESASTGFAVRTARVLRRGGDWTVLALYLVLGVAVTAFMTASCLTSPESIVQEYDNVHHLGVVQAFLQSGVWSPFAANLYSAPDAAAFNPLPLGGFYPTAWSMLAALAASLTGCSVPVAANAVNCAISAVVYPTSLFFLMRALFPARPDVQAVGAVVMLASTQFPWALMIFGPLYPNMLAYALMPAVAACFICWLGPVRIFAGRRAGRRKRAGDEGRVRGRRDTQEAAFPATGRTGGERLGVEGSSDAMPAEADRQSSCALNPVAARYPLARPAAHGRWFLLMLAGVVTCVFAQPNAVFSLGVFLVPYIVAKAYGRGRRQAIVHSVAPTALASERSACSPSPEHSACSPSPAACPTVAASTPGRTGRLAGWRWAAVACVLIAGTWLAMFNVPMIQAVASFMWAATKTLPQALREVGLLMFRFASFNGLLALFVWVGVFLTVRCRRWLWVSCSFGLLCALYVVAQTVDGPVKALLTGFWYTDSLRLAAAAAIFAMPLAALGLAAVTRWIAALLARLMGWRSKRSSGSSRIPRFSRASRSAGRNGSSDASASTSPASAVPSSSVDSASASAASTIDLSCASDLADNRFRAHDSAGNRCEVPVPCASCSGRLPSEARDSELRSARGLSAAPVVPQFASRLGALRVAVGAALSAVFLVASFGVSVPVNLGPLQHLGPDDQWFEPTTGMGAVVRSLSEMTDGTRTPKLSDDERDFIRQVQAIVPDDSPIANLPFDGSAWAYGAMGLNGYYRYIGTYGVAGETPESRLIRQHLDEYADNQAVRDAVNKLGIRYVLQLDQGAHTPVPGDDAFLHAQGDGFDWSGLASIDDDTPGFTPVLSQDDMRLYKIG